MRDSSRFVWIAIVIVALFAWRFYHEPVRTSGIEHAEFRVLYANARDALDSYSQCQTKTEIAQSGKTVGEQIELQKQFAAFRERISDGRFADDHKAVDLEFQLKDRNPQTRMEDHSIRCARLLPLGIVKQADVTKSFSRLETFLNNY